MKRYEMKSIQSPVVKKKRTKEKLRLSDGYLYLLMAIMYLPILIQWMRKEKDQDMIRRFVLPILALCGSVFMVVASIFSHGMGCFWYLIVFVVIMAIGALFARKRK